MINKFYFNFIYRPMDWFWRKLFTKSYNDE